MERGEAGGRGEGRGVVGQRRGAEAGGRGGEDVLHQKLPPGDISRNRRGVWDAGRGESDLGFRSIPG